MPGAPGRSGHKRGFFRSSFWRRLFYSSLALTVLILATGGILAAYIAKIAPDTPSVDDLLEARNARPSILLSANGTQLATYSRGWQEQVPLNRVSAYVIRALIATEDHRFYDHQGIDIMRTASAVLHTLAGDAQGGSTITQQLVRNMFPEEIGRSRTITRKLREIITALKIEKAYTKDQILETYLNTVPFLYNVVGIEMAARTYFNKSSSDLNALESATLIGMLKGTSYYNPIINPARAQKRRNVVLAQMVKRGMLDQAEFEALRDAPIRVGLHRQPDPLGIAPHFAAYVRKQLIEWAEEHDYNIYTDGLVIESTIDDDLQQAAEEAVARQSEVLQMIADVEWGQKSERVASQTPGAYVKLHQKAEPFRYFWEEHEDLLDSFIRETPQYRKVLASGKSDAAALAKLKANGKFMARLRADKTRLEAGFVAMDPASREIKAWIGSRDFERDQFDHVAQAERQPGSTFKPIVYGAALEQGVRPDRLYADSPVNIRMADGGIWRPTDMSGNSGRMMSLREGLIYSKNVITAQVMQETGLSSIIDLARAVGIRQSRLAEVPSLALGTSPVTLLEMVSAYSTIAQAGEYREPVSIRRILDRHGKVLAEFGKQEGEQVMSRDTAVELIDMMRGVVRYGTGSTVKAQFNITADIAGKTGTTQNNTDGWFILMHPDLVAGAWVGFNDQRVAMRSDYWGQGGHNAALLVGDFFRDTLKSRLINVKAKFPQPKRQAPLIVQGPREDWANRPGVEPNTMPPGYGVISRGDGRAVIIAPDGTQTMSRSGTAVASSEDPLGRFLRDMGRRRGSAESSGSSGAIGERNTGPGMFP